MSQKKEIETDTDEYKTRKLREQGGSVIATLPKKLVEDTADEAGMTLGEFLQKYELSIELVRDPKGSILNGAIEVFFVEKGGGLKP